MESHNPNKNDGKALYNITTSALIDVELSA